MRKLSTVGFALLLAGCASLKPDYTKPAVDLPVGWRDAPADGVQARDARWWKVYGEAALETVLITLTSDVAQGYFALRAFDGQLAATRRSLAARSEALGMQKKRFEVGDISEFDYRQLQADVAAERALLPVLELQRAQQENALAVLLGKSPRAIHEGALEAGSDPEDRTVAIVVPAGLPSDLLLRRPDLVQAEQRLIATNARVAVARAAYFPTPP